MLKINTTKTAMQMRNLFYNSKRNITFDVSDGSPYTTIAPAWSSNENGQYIREILRPTDTVLTVAGSLDNAIDIPSMRNHIEAVTREYNIKYAADKPYIIHTSVGVYPFVCSATLEIGELLSHADILLYEEKKHKRSILKSDYE